MAANLPGGGLPASIDTVIVEGGKPGGTSLTVGCIPSKALIHAAEEFDATRKMLAETSDGRPETPPADRILVTVGRRPGAAGSWRNAISIGPEVASFCSEVDIYALINQRQCRSITSA